MKGTSAARHEWLEKATKELRSLFTDKGFTVPANVRVSVGWPSTRRGGRIGECWYEQGSQDKFNEVFISPELGARTANDIKSSVRVLDVLAHELAHTVAGSAAGHKAPFKRVATAIGLTGKMTATVAGEEFAAWGKAFVAEHGTYPAGSLAGATNGRKKQTTRLLKVCCEECGYTARVTAKWIAEAGTPICPTDGVMMEQE